MEELEGALEGVGLRIGIVVARFNGVVTERLLEGARSALLGRGVREDDIMMARVPGSFELPLAAKGMVQARRPDAVVCLGAVVRGETPHFDYVAGEAARGIAQVSLETGVPVTFGVITANTMEQALARAGGRVGNKGYDAALAAIEMANLMRKMSEIPAGRQLFKRLS